LAGKNRITEMLLCFGDIFDGFCGHINGRNKTLINKNK